MSGTKKVIYWDACVYLAWIKEESDHGDEALDALRETAIENSQGKLTILTSTLTFVEVLSGKFSDEQERKFRKTFRNPYHIAKDVDPPIALKARDFRSAFVTQKKKLATPDAIHLATASIYNAEFWTFDDGHSDKKSVGLLGLDGDSRVDGLKICKPSISQRQLPLRRISFDE